MTLFCTQDECNTEICSRCYLGQHKLYNVIVIDEEQEKCAKILADIRSMLAVGNEEIVKVEENIGNHYMAEMQRLNKLEKNALRLIKSFVKRKTTEISKNKENSMESLKTVKAEFDDTKKKIETSLDSD